MFSSSTPEENKGPATYTRSPRYSSLIVFPLPFRLQVFHFLFDALDVVDLLRVRGLLGEVPEVPPNAGDALQGGHLPSRCFARAAMADSIASFAVCPVELALITRAPSRIVTSQYQ